MPGPEAPNPERIACPPGRRPRLLSPAQRAGLRSSPAILQAPTGRDNQRRGQVYNSLSGRLLRLREGISHAPSHGRNGTEVCEGRAPSGGAERGRQTPAGPMPPMSTACPERSGWRRGREKKVGFHLGSPRREAEGNHQANPTGKVIGCSSVGVSEKAFPGSSMQWGTPFTPPRPGI